MITSKYILDIFDLILDGYHSADLLKNQIPYLLEKNREHTGGGLYIYFTTEKGVENYKIKESSIDILDGLEVQNKKLNILADIILHLRNGVINCIEIWNKNGEKYPLDDPIQYEMKQLWLPPSKRRTIIK